jgi:hypothetical protein
MIGVMEIYSSGLEASKWLSLITHQGQTISSHKHNDLLCIGTGRHGWRRLATAHHTHLELYIIVRGLQDPIHRVMIYLVWLPSRAHTRTI